MLVRAWRHIWNFLQTGLWGDDRVKLFIYEYGNVLSGVLFSMIIMAAIFSGFMKKWQEFGGVDDSIKTDFLTDEEKRTPPVLRACDFKIREGDPLDVEQHVSASDFDGRDISDRIQMKCVREKPGLLRYELRVESPVTGKVVCGRMTVLIDCPEGGGV